MRTLYETRILSRVQRPWSPGLCRPVELEVSQSVNSTWVKRMSEDPEFQQTSRANYLGLGIALGAGFGAAFGVALGNISLGVGLGTAAGIVIGAVMSQVKKKDAG